MIPGIDLTAERELLAPHDFRALHERMLRSLGRRLVWRSVGATVAAAVIGVGAWTAARSSGSEPTPSTGPCPPCGAPIVTAAMPAAPTAVSVPATEPTPTPPAATVPVTPRRAEPRATPAAAPMPVAPSVSVAASPATAGGDDVVDGERFALRAQLRLYAEAREALAHDPARAQALARDLVARWPAGPLAVEAGLIEVRALAALDRAGEARARLSQLEAKAGDAGKGEAWRELSAALSTRRIIGSTRDGPSAPSPEAQRDDDGDEDGDGDDDPDDGHDDEPAP